MAVPTTLHTRGHTPCAGLNSGLYNFPLTGVLFRIMKSVQYTLDAVFSSNATSALTLATTVGSALLG